MSVTEPFTAPTSPEDVKRYIEENDIEFLFAQFVDMHGKPNAKLVPARLFDGLMEDGAGFAGFAAGAIGQFPHDPDLAAMPDVRSFTPLPWKPGVARLACDVHVEGEEWPYCPRTILRRQLDRAQGARLRVHDRRRARVLPRARDRGRRNRAGGPARPPRPALLRHARPHPQPRLRLAGGAQPHGPRLEQLRHRPRGRERPVRAELRLRRRAHHGRPRDLLPLHGRVARPGARDDRDVHAEAVRPPHRQRLPLPHEPVEGRRERVRVRPLGRPARARPHRDRRTSSSAG